MYKLSSLLKAFMGLFIAIFAFFPDKIYAATYYVAGDVGSDSNTSAQAQNTATPWRTIQKAADTMVAGDTVNVKGGITYTGNNSCWTNMTVVCPKNTGTAVSRIVYQAWAGTGIPVIDASATNFGFHIRNSKGYITVSGFEIKNAQGNNIYSATEGNIFVNNIIHGGYGMNIQYATVGVKVYNNTFYNLGGGIEAMNWMNPTFLEIKNNIFTNTTGAAISLFYDASNDNNLFFNNESDYASSLGIGVGTHDVHANPLFVDPANNNYTLQTNSPAINAGVDLTASGVTTDILGRARPNVGAFDIGAYEDANLYVDGNAGNDSNNGSLSSPFLTIQAAANIATAGDNVNVKGGIIYSGSNSCSSGNAIVCIAGNSGIPTDYITYKPWPGFGTPTLRTTSFVRAFNMHRAYQKINGFVLDGAGIGAAGVVVFDSGASNNIYENNIVKNFTVGAGGIVIVAGSSNRIYNNVFYNNGGAFGPLVVSNLDLLANNIIYANQIGFCINVSANFLNNNVFGNTGNQYICQAPNSSNFSVDPLFVEPSSGNFHLQKNSPMYNAGVNLSANGVVDDAAGVSRPQGSAFDIGAFEYYDIPVTVSNLATTGTNPTFTGTATTLSDGSIVSISYSVDSNSWSSTGVIGTSSYSITTPTLIDGIHTIRVRATDSFGNTTDSNIYASDDFVVDAIAPTGSIAINNGELVINNRNVLLTLTAIDSRSVVTQMMVSQNATFVGSSWESYSATKTFTLSTGEGVRTIYVKYKDAVGNVSETYSDSIVVDTVILPPVITSLGLIDNIPDNPLLFYYFTSQTPLIKGIAEANSVVHFTYRAHDYRTTADSNGKFEVSIPELPRELVSMTYYAVDPAGNQSTSKILKLIIGIENFPQEPVTPTPTESVGVSSKPTITTTVTITSLPQTGEEKPILPTIVVVEVTDSNGKLLANTAVYINGQKYITDVKGQLYIEQKPNAGMNIKAEIGGSTNEAKVFGDKIVVTAKTNSTVETGFNYWWLVLILAVLLIAYLYKIQSKWRPGFEKLLKRYK
jgi:hypothetical protein